MRVVTFNIRHGTVGSGSRVDAERLAEVCDGFGADVLALQEVDRGRARSGRVDLAATVARVTGMASAFGPSLQGSDGEYGNALLVRGQIDHWSVHPLPGGSARSRPQEPRTALVASVRVGSVSLRVVATHLAVPSWLGLVQLEAVLDLAAALPAPVVVLGDLNREPAEVGPPARRAGFDLAAHRPTHPARWARSTIDHVLHGPGLTVTDTAVERTPMSDHRALVVDLAVDG